jgi:hypothetical protein
MVLVCFLLIRINRMWAGPAPTTDPQGGLAVFDSEGTLLQGPTVCQMLAQNLPKHYRFQRN